MENKAIWEVRGQGDGEFIWLGGARSDTSRWDDLLEECCFDEAEEEAGYAAAELSTEDLRALEMRSNELFNGLSHDPEKAANFMAKRLRGWVVKITTTKKTMTAEYVASYNGYDTPELSAEALEPGRLG